MKRVPDLKTDAEAEAFLEQDLSDLDFTQFKPMRLAVAKKETRVSHPLDARKLQRNHRALRRGQ